MRGNAELPYPPLELMNRVCSLEGRGDPVSAYERLGAEAKAALLALLGDDWSFDGKRVLDFGCGAGRTLRQFTSEATSDAEFWGVDIDAASIAWLRGTLSPPFRVMTCSDDPPLAVEPGSFDLIWALSVFTHLTDNSLPWLLELHRLLRPGGLLVATYMGRYTGEVFTHEPWEENRIGMNVLRRNQGWEDGGPMVLMSDWWVRARWGRAFQFLDQAVVHGQSWVLLRKRDVDVSLRDLARPGDDPREYEALQNNLRQVERDAELALAEVHSRYEGSLSWRLTRPLRQLSRRARVNRRFSAWRS
jgi:SAM-dependent methyltransferase